MLPKFRRGLDYDNKGARETALLTRLAEVSGKDLPTFMQEAEQQMIQMQLEREMQNVRAQLPEGTPDEAIRMIAQKECGGRQQPQSLSTVPAAADAGPAGGQSETAGSR